FAESSDNTHSLTLVQSDNRILVGAGPGALPVVNVYFGDGTPQTSFLAFDPSFRGGVRAAMGGDFNHDGFNDFVCAAGPGGGPHVKVFSGRDLSLIASFMAYDLSFHGGVNVAVGLFDLDGVPDIVTGAGPGGGPHVKVFSG